MRSTIKRSRPKHDYGRGVHETAPRPRALDGNGENNLRNLYNLISYSDQVILKFYKRQNRELVWEK